MEFPKWLQLALAGGKGELELEVEQVRVLWEGRKGEETQRGPKLTALFAYTLTGSLGRQKFNSERPLSRSPSAGHVFQSARSHFRAQLCDEVWSNRKR